MVSGTQSFGPAFLLIPLKMFTLMIVQFLQDKYNFYCGFTQGKVELESFYHFETPKNFRIWTFHYLLLIRIVYQIAENFR